MPGEKNLGLADSRAVRRKRRHPLNYLKNMIKFGKEEFEGDLLFRSS
jgi:hypothetical protein